MNKQNHRSLGSDSPIDVNVCSGAGGLALGLVQAGFEPTRFYDTDPRACVTLRHNISSDASPLRGIVHERDIRKIDWTCVGPDVRLLAAGAPCQPFSMGGSRKGPQDQRNLFPELVAAVRAVRPRAVMIENVRGLDRGPHKSYLDYVVRQISFINVGRLATETWQEHDQRLRNHSSGKHPDPFYRVRWAALNAADFGVPQVRYRLFIVATQVGVPEYRFPEPTHSKHKLMYHKAVGTYWEERDLPKPEELTQPSLESSIIDDKLPWVTVRDALIDLPPLSAEQDTGTMNHWLIPGARSYPGHTGSHLDWPSKTVKAGVHGVPGGENTLICDDGSLRYYSIREMARIQTFPDYHYFPGARSNVTRQIGNAVPCDLATAVARPLRELLD